MDELKLLIEMVAGLPALAVWVLVGYLVYKVAVVGSIYGLLRFAIDKTHDWLVTRKTRTESVAVVLDGIVITDVKEKLIAELRRVMVVQRYQSNYVHDFTINWLREAIDDKIAKEQAAEKK